MPMEHDVDELTEVEAKQLLQKLLSMMSGASNPMQMREQEVAG